MNDTPLIPAEETPVAHGYTLADIHDFARKAVLMAGYGASDAAGRYDTAWDAITGMLLTAADPPTGRDLRFAGMKAVQRGDREERRQHGYDQDGGHAHRFAWYWNPQQVSSPEDGVVDRVAVAQIWEVLRPVHRRVLTALAVHGDWVSAAKACGKNPQTFASHLSNARREFRRLWHEGEVPSGLWGKDDRRHQGAQAVTLSLRARTAGQVRRRAEAGTEAA